MKGMFMPESYNCFTCKRVIPLIGKDHDKCPSCGGINGHFVSKEDFDERFKAGAYFNIDPKTGKAQKPKKR